MEQTRNSAGDAEHPFARFVRILGKGKSGSRSLDQAEAREAFAMILRGETEPLQTGAFLMLLRVKEETGEELAGFVQACRDNMRPASGISADLDWSSYAGKRHQHPWFILSLLLLAQAGVRVLVHGTDGHTPGRLYTEDAMRQLGLPVASNWEQTASQLDAHQLSYLPLRAFCPPLDVLLHLKPLLGLRSPVNTLTRMLNPLRAPCSIQSVFHPAYAALHQQADRILGQPRALVFKGESGEVEVKPQADSRLSLLAGDLASELLLPRRLGERVAPVAMPAVQALREFWRGRNPTEDCYAMGAVLGTTAAALLLLRPELDVAAAQAEAHKLWQARDTGSLG